MEAYKRHKLYITWPSRDRPAKYFPRLSLFLRLFEVSGIHPGWTENCLVRGLEFLAAMLSSDEPYATLDFFAWGTSCHRLIPSIVFDPDAEPEVKERMEAPQIDSIEQANDAWLWAIQSCRHYRRSTKHEVFHEWSSDECTINYCRSWGYVIWDHARLERLAILTKSPSEILATMGTAWLVNRTEVSLKARTMQQEEIWSREIRSQSALFSHFPTGF